MNKKDVKAELWRRGNLKWKLRKYQVPIYNAIRESDDKQFMLNCSRRLGKTTILCIIALEDALTTKDGMFQFTTSTGKAMRGIVRPIFNMLLEDCPDNLKPQWKGSDDYYYFPSTDSEIHLAGSNNNHEDDSRGRRRNKCFVDEGQSIDQLQYLIDSVLMPQTIDQPGGQVLIAGTPPESPAHYYKSLYMKLSLKGAVQEYTIYDNTMLKATQLAEYIEEAGGEDSTTFKREYLVKFVVETERAIIPEWTYKGITKEVEPDEYFDYYQKYESIDMGGADNTALLFGYYDFREACLMIQKEYVVAGHLVTTSLIADAVKAGEKELKWTEVFRRVSDTDNRIFVHDLNINYGYPFVPTNKDNLHAMVNKVREWVKQGRLQVDPSCENLLGCLEAGIWDIHRKKFERLQEYGHFDALASLIYMVRNIDEWTNNVPIYHNKPVADHHHHMGPQTPSDTNTTRENLKNFFKATTTKPKPKTKNKR